jgi:large subunit ribosomal protein L3
MGKTSRPRRGSLQYWPRKRARKILPSVNWKIVVEKNSNKKLMGFLGYKVGMQSAFVKDNTPDSMTSGKRIAIPVTIIECPPLKIYSVRFYKNGVVANEILGSSLDKELKRIVKVPKSYSKKIDEIKSEFDDVKIMVYGVVKKTSIKKRPDMVEIALGGSIEDKMAYIKENIGKEISATSVFKENENVDVRGITKGKGNQGPVKRFGIALRSHKAEKGVRKVGSIGPWHPARVTFRVPMAGQMGMFTRTSYNGKIVSVGKISEKDINPSSGFKHFGKIKTDYVVLRGSIPGPAKRVVAITSPLRITKKQSKKNFELIELR